MQIEPPSPLNFSMNPPSKSMSEIPGRPDVTKSQQKTFLFFAVVFALSLFLAGSCIPALSSWTWMTQASQMQRLIRFLAKIATQA